MIVMKGIGTFAVTVWDHNVSGLAFQLSNKSPNQWFCLSAAMAVAQSGQESLKGIVHSSFILLKSLVIL